MNKKERFAAEPMGQKSAKKVPGIGRAIGKRLNDAGIYHAKEIQEKVGDEGPACLKQYGANAKHRGDADEAFKSQDEKFGK